jgi:hypothetical protein
LEEVKSAVFKAGAGQYETYDQCCYQTRVTGQFRPLDGSNAYMGQANELCQATEYKVEMLCGADSIESVIEALKSAHPYEVPPYEAWPLTYHG